MPIQPNFRVGDVLTAQFINELIREKNAALNIKGGPGIEVRATGDGNVQILMSRKVSYIFKGKVAAGGITARTSDASHGTGNVEIWTKTGGGSTYIDSGSLIAVDYISSTTGGLAAGVWVNCMWREDGGADIISVDCGN